MIRLIIILSCAAFLYACIEFNQTKQGNPQVNDLLLNKENVHPTKTSKSATDQFDVHAVLEQKCSRCHGGEKTKGSFDIVRLLDKGIKQEDSESWNEVYRVLQDGDMPPEDEEQLSDEEHLKLMTSLESELKSSRKVSRLMAADEIINTLSDIFDIDSENDNQMENLFSYQNHEYYSTIDNKQIMSVFFMNDLSKILDDVINEYVNLKTVDQKATKSSIYDTKKMEINSVGFASRSHYWPTEEFIDLRGRYEPHANALKQTGARDLNLPPGRYKLTINAATFNRASISKVNENYSNRGRLKDELAKLNIYVMPVYRKTRPSSLGKEKLIKSFFIKDEKFENYSVEFDLKRATPVGISFENGPHSRGRLKSAFKDYPKDGVPPEQHIYPFIRFKDISLTLLKSKSNFMSMAKNELNDHTIKEKLKTLIHKLSVDVSADDLMFLYRQQLAKGIDAFAAYKKTLKSVFLSPEFLYLENFGNDQKKLRFASYSLLKSTPDQEFSEIYNKVQKDKMKPQEFVTSLVEHKNFERFVNRFAYEWLHLHEMISNQPDEEIFKEFYMENYAYAFIEQTNLFVKDLFVGNRSLKNLVQSDYTFVNDNLQRFYGLGFSSKPGFRKVPLKDSARGGLMTQGSFLAATSNGVEALPFKRAEWISSNILNKDIPPPPDNISVQEFEEAKGTFAEKMKVHSTNSQCASCHKLIDPIASKLRYFDSIGRIEHHFSKSEVEPEIKALKEKYTRATYRTSLAFAKRIISFTTGRKTDISDYQMVEKLVDNCSENDYKAADLLAEVIKEYF